MASNVLLVYWNVRGMTQPIRTLLEYTGQKYEQKLYEFDTTDVSDGIKTRGKWPADKVTDKVVIGGDGEEPFEFPNLPYFVETRPDGSKFKLTQSLAILKYIGTQNNLGVKGVDNTAKLDMYFQQANDLLQGIIDHCYAGSISALHYPDYVKGVKQTLQRWDKFLTGKSWVFGDKLTYVDFLLYEAVDWHIILDENILDTCPTLKAYVKRFRELPRVAAYFASERFKSWPLVSPFSKNFGWYR